MAFSDVAANAALAYALGPNGSRLSVALFKSNQQVDDTTDYTTLTEADFDGYARAVANWSAPAGQGDGSSRSYSDPLMWVKGADDTLNQTLYSWTLFQTLTDGTLTQLTTRNLPYPVPMSHKGRSLELDVALGVVLDPEDNSQLIYAVEAQIVFRGGAIMPSDRGRLKAMRHSIEMAQHADYRVDQRFEATGDTRHGSILNDTEVVNSAQVIIDRIEQLLGRNVSSVRVDTPLKQEVEGEIQQQIPGAVPGEFLAPKL